MYSSLQKRCILAYKVHRQQMCAFGPFLHYCVCYIEEKLLLDVNLLSCKTRETFRVSVFVWFGQAPLLNVLTHIGFAVHFVVNRVRENYKQ